MTTKMTAEDRRREWAKLAVRASELTGDRLPPEIYERARGNAERPANSSQPKNR